MIPPDQFIVIIYHATHFAASNELYWICFLTFLYLYIRLSYFSDCNVAEFKKQICIKPLGLLTAGYSTDFHVFIWYLC